MSHTVRRRKEHQGSWQHASLDPRKRGDAPPAAPPKRAAKSERHALVTDHAVLRWLERVTGIDVATQVREEILARGREQLIPKVGNGRIAIADSDAVLQIVSGRVITVLTRSQANG